MKYKTCTKCKYPWDTREELLADPLIEMIGYQADTVDPDQGLLLFNHLIRGCNTTFAVLARDFNDFYNGPHYEQILTGTDKCQGLCLDIHNLEPCEAKCKLAFPRKIIQKIKNWPKKQARQ